MPFSAVHVIVPQHKKERALMAAKEAGAKGVTMTEAHGMGLEEMENFYNRLNSSPSDVDLMFITKTSNVESIIQNIIKELGIIHGREGIAFSYPIENLKGLTLTQNDL